MDKPLFKSLCGFSLASASIIIGTVQAVLYAGIFFWEYAVMIVRYIEFEVPFKYAVEGMTLMEMTNGATLTCCIFNIILIVGVRKSRPGFILTWLLNQLTWITSSFLTMFYYLIAFYLRITVMEAMLELCLTGLQTFCLIIVLSHYVRLRSGNLSEEP